MSLRLARRTHLRPAAAPGIQVVDQAQNGVSGANSCVVTLNGPTNAGDTVVVIAGTLSPGRTTSSCTGLGATWTRQEATQSGSAVGIDVWVGENCTAGGTQITVGYPFTTTSNVLVVLLRGCATSSFVTGAAGSGINNNIDPTGGNVLSPAVGNVIVAGWAKNVATDTTSFTDTPATWTVLSSRETNNCGVEAAYRISTSAVSHNHIGLRTDCSWAAAGVILAKSA